jgi:sec-independent protein translocase protein TatA
MGTFSLFHWVIALVVLLLLFGNRLPQVMRSLGKGVVEFKKGLQGIEDDINTSTTAQIEKKDEAPSKTT